MRSIPRHLAGIGAVLALLLAVPATPANAETSGSCNASTSRRLLTIPILGSGDNRLWVDSPSPTRTLVCFDFPFLGIGSGVVVVDTSSSGTPPAITPGSNPADCGFEIVAPSDPVAFRLAIDVPKSMVCFSLADKTVTLKFSTGSVSGTPTLEVWHDGTFSWFDVVSCPVPYALSEVGAGSDDCMTTPGRVI